MLSNPLRQLDRKLILKEIDEQLGRKQNLDVVLSAQRLTPVDKMFLVPRQEDIFLV